MLFLQLPLSLISSSLLLLAASAIPVSSTELTPDTFSATIAKGLWFIEHFSPQCGHCRHFKPTWDKLVAESDSEIPKVKMATLNCLVYGDLCDKNGVKGYPSLLMFEDGKKIDEFKGARELDELKTFMKRHIKEEPAPPPTPSPPATVKKASKPSLNLQGDVVALTSETFSSTLGKGPAFVKFYAPWCGHCKKLAPVWKQLARHLQNKVTVAEVNCDDHASLCKAQNVQGYPTLVWYGKGDDELARSEYTAGRKLDQLKAFAEKASAAGLHILEKPADLDGHVQSDSVVYLLVHSASDTEVLDTVREASASLLGSPKIFASSSPDLYTKFSIPTSTPWALIAIKDHDTQLPSSIYSGGSTSSDEKLQRWLLTHRLPTALELTQDTFQSVMSSPQAPLVLIAAATGPMKEKIGERLRDVGKKWRVRTDGSGVVHGREVVFAWMDSERWAEWLKSMYGITKQDADELDAIKVVIADHKKLIYYDADQDGNSIKFSSSASLFAAVDDAASGKSSYKNSESFIERVARSLNNKMQAIEAYVTAKPLQSVFFILLIGVGVIYVFIRLFDTDSSSQDEWRELKGKNRRLD